MSKNNNNTKTTIKMSIPDYDYPASYDKEDEGREYDPDFDNIFSQK